MYSFSEYITCRKADQNHPFTCVLLIISGVSCEKLPVLHWIFLLTLLRRSWEWIQQFDFVLLILLVDGYPCPLHQTHIALHAVALCTCWKYKWNLFCLLFYKYVNINVMFCLYISGKKEKNLWFSRPIRSN